MQDSTMTHDHVSANYQTHDRQARDDANNGSARVLYKYDDQSQWNGQGQNSIPATP